MNKVWDYFGKLADHVQFQFGEHGLDDESTRNKSQKAKILSLYKQ